MKSVATVCRTLQPRVRKQEVMNLLQLASIVPVYRRAQLSPAGPELVMKSSFEGPQCNLPKAAPRADGSNHFRY